jgi:hypothetical protein
MAAYDTGYEDERFEHVVSQILQRFICTNGFKDAVTTCQNQHYFCRTFSTSSAKDVRVDFDRSEFSHVVICIGSYLSKHLISIHKRLLCITSFVYHVFRVSRLSCITFFRLSF